MQSMYEMAKERYAALGVDVERAMEKLRHAPVSLHCWQGDDVRGFDTDPTKPLTGGIQTTGNYPRGAPAPPRSSWPTWTWCSSCAPAPRR